MFVWPTLAAFGAQDSDRGPVLNRCGIVCCGSRQRLRVLRRRRYHFRQEGALSGRNEDVEFIEDWDIAPPVRTIAPGFTVG